MRPAAPPHQASAVQRQDSLSSQQQKYIESLRTTAETLDIARETSVALSQQSEALDRAERNLDLTEAAVKQANHVVRGMTWSGWLYNKFTKEPQLRSTAGAGSTPDISMGFICPECRVAQRSQHALMEHYEAMHSSPSTDALGISSSSGRAVSIGAFRSEMQQSNLSSTARQPAQATAASVDAEGLNIEQRKFLEALTPQLLEMKHASLAIGNALDAHNAQLDRLESKSEKTKDDMRLVTAKAIKLTNETVTIDFKFRCAIQEEQTQRFLANVDGEPVFCKDTATDTCIFRAFTLAGNGDVWGFQHEESLKWLGITMFGAIKIQGAALKSYEQFALDAGREWTTLYSFASAFGQGGWVCVKPETGALQCIRRTSTNKDLAMRVKLVLVEAGERRRQ
ncbi:Aste57867_50 [Aphanomyces stellatus]|uniref:Aste57867_50 protein n=1 Tax=Aphanomyces stellatus TaxID=120398 RepID=A0A485K2S1_9STRA|nr:hypothetical protein As57867_000050 [Aphanomyces stellatus]VFT77276.1 Aste57867_50 [Aphanomyces stellatus]